MKNNKSSKFVLVALVLVGILMMSACAGPAAPTPAAPGAPAATGGGDVTEPIRIGWIGNLTGDLAVWGISCRAGAIMMAEELNERGGLLGRPVEIVDYDVRGDAAEAVNATRRLGTVDGVVGVLGPNLSGLAIPMATPLEESRIPGIATVATNPRVTVDDAGNPRPFNFRVCFVDAYQGAVGAGFAFNVLGARRAAALYDVGSDYSLGISEEFFNHFIALGGEVVAFEGFNPGDVDFRPQLTSIRDANPCVLFMPIVFREVALASQQARELGIETQFLGTDTWPSMQLIEMAGEFVEGSYFINHLDVHDPRGASLRERYIARWDREPEVNPFLTADAFRVLVEAIERAGSLDDPYRIRDEIRYNTDFIGYTGRIRISPDDHNPIGKEAAMIRIQGGEFVFVQNYSPTLP